MTITGPIPMTKDTPLSLEREELKAKAAGLIKEYRPTMMRDIVHSWASDVVDTMPRLLAALEEAEEWKGQFDTSEGVIRDLTNDLAVSTIRAEKAERQVAALEKLLGVEVIDGTRGYCLEQERCACGGDVPAIRKTCGNWFPLSPSNSEADNG